jgi:hypothetical protein
MGAVVTLNNNALTELLYGSNGFVAAEVQRRTLRVHAAARKNCPVDTGRLRSSIRWKMIRDHRGVVGVVGTDVIYALSASENAKDPEKRNYLERALEEAGG